MANQTGIAITINAFLPTGKTLDQQFEALSLVKTAHASGDYAALIASSIDVLVKTEQKTRRIPDAVPTPEPADVPEIFDQAKFDADYERGFEAGKADAAIHDPDFNNEAFNHGWAAGNDAQIKAANAAMNTMPAPVSLTEMVDLALSQEEVAYNAGFLAAEDGREITNDQANNADFMAGFSAGDKARSKTKKPKAA